MDSLHALISPAIRTLSLLVFAFFITHTKNNNNTRALRVQTSAKGAHQNPPKNYLAITSFKKYLDLDDPDSDPDHSQNLNTCSI